MGFLKKSILSFVLLTVASFLLLFSFSQPVSAQYGCPVPPQTCPSIDPNNPPSPPNGHCQGCSGVTYYCGSASPGYELYSLPQNDPLSILPNFEQIIRENQRELPYGGQILGAGAEIAKLQRMILMSTWIGDIAPQYFSSSK